MGILDGSFFRWGKSDGAGKSSSKPKSVSPHSTQFAHSHTGPNSTNSAQSQHSLRKDLLKVVLFVLDEARLAGPLNATAPAPVRHAELMTAIAATLHRPLWPLRIPKRLLRAGVGEVAELFVDGQRVTPDRLQALGFEFRYATIDAALREALAPTGRAAASVDG